MNTLLLFKPIYVMCCIYTYVSMWLYQAWSREQEGLLLGVRSRERELDDRLKSLTSHEEEATRQLLRDRSTEISGKYRYRYI